MPIQPVFKKCLSEPMKPDQKKKSILQTYNTYLENQTNTQYSPLKDLGPRLLSVAGYDADSVAGCRFSCHFPNQMPIQKMIKKCCLNQRNCRICLTAVVREHSIEVLKKSNVQYL